MQYAIDATRKRLSRKGKCRKVSESDLAMYGVRSSSGTRLGRYEVRNTGEDGFVVRLTKIRAS